MAITHLNKASFKTFLSEAKLPVLVDFWADWCGPCRMLAPIVSELSDELDGKLEVCKVDVDESGDIAESFGILSIPTLILFVNSAEKERVTGLRSKADLMEILNKYM